MNEYFFQQRINTIAEIWKPFEFKGFRFEAHQRNITEGTQRGWIASKTVLADDVDTALRIVFSELHPLVDRISFVAQCFAVIALESYLVKRIDRPEFFLRLSKQRRPVPLSFGSEELDSLKALETYNEKGDAFRYLREAINSPDFYARLAMLVSALEGIAGEKKIGLTDRDYIEKQILDDKVLYDKIFVRIDGIRNQLLHGRKVDVQRHGGTPYASNIYENIVDYFNKNHGTNIKTRIINPPRTIGLNYKVWSGWLNPISDENQIAIDLENFAGKDLHDATKLFNTINRPNDY